MSLFVIELFVAMALFCRHAGRPSWRHAWLVVALYVVLTVLTCLGLLDTGGVVRSSLYYAVVFLVCTHTVSRVFSLSPVASLVVGTLGYCMQHLSSDVSFIFLADLYSSGMNLLLFQLANTAFLAIDYLAIWFLVARDFKVDEDVARRRSLWVFACALTVLFLIVFRLLFPETQTGQMRVVLYVYDALVTLFVMLTLVTLSRVDGLRSDLATQEAIWRGKRDQYELARDNMELINIKCHDIRKHVRAMGDASISQESIERIHESINIYDAQTRTGNEALDVVLTEKRLFCSQAGIELICMADGSGLSFMPDDDVYFLFCNILDNAIEATLNLADDERRSITLTVRREGGFVTVREDNFYDGDLRFVEGLPATTKTDRANHGFGMRSIRRCAEEHGGELKVRAEKGVFSLVVLLPEA